MQWGFREERVPDPRDGRTGLTDLRERRDSEIKLAQRVLSRSRVDGEIIAVCRTCRQSVAALVQFVAVMASDPYEGYFVRLFLREQ